MADDQPPRNVRLGRIASAAGLRGWLKIQSYTDPPENLLQYKVWELADAQGRREPYQLAEARSDGRLIRVRLEGVASREAAEALRGHDIEVARSALPPTAAREYYRDDLIGLRVRTLEGAELGRVSHFLDAPSAPLMVVQGEGEHWIPAVPRFLRRVDLSRGEIAVDWRQDL